MTGRFLKSTMGVLVFLLAAACGGPSAVTDAGITVDSGTPEPVVDAGTHDAGSGLTPISISISPGGHERFYGVTYDAQGRIYAVGQVTGSPDAGEDIATTVVRLSSAGVLDPTFGTGGIVVRNAAVGLNGELFRGIVVQSTGKVVVSGTVEHVGAVDARDRDIALMRFNSDGSKDTTFGADGIVTLDLSTGIASGSAFLADSAWGLDMYPDDRLVISGGQVRTGGTDTDFALIRLSSEGLRDVGFATNGVFTFDTLLPDGGSNNASARNVTILPGTQGVLGAGYQPVPGFDTSPVVYKVTDTGALDATFGTGGAFVQSVLEEQTESYQVVVQPKAGGVGYDLVTTGYGRALASETTDFVSLRMTSSGVLDPTWGTNGLARLDLGGFGDNSRRLVVLPDRRVLMVGGGRPTSANVDGAIAILTPDGAPDTSFAPGGFRLVDLGGPADFFWSVALAPGGKTAAIVGIRGVGTTPTTVGANDDAVVLLLPLP